ncbi:MAG: CotH kinase family protein [Myxococcota bacterium]
MLLLLACADRSVPLSPELPAEDAGDAPAWVACEGEPAVVLNEAMASNTQEDDDLGDRSDWVEVAAVENTSLAGWALSEDAEPAFTFPIRELGAGEALRVWASGRDADLHLPFALDTLGDELFLLAPEGCVADHVTLPRLYADESWGRRVDDGRWEHFLAPTPGEPNTTESRPGFAPTPTLTPAGGFDVGEVEVAGEGVLRYTRDGSVPGEDAEEVNGPVDVDGEVLRVRAFVDGLWPSRDAVGSYLADPGTGLAVVSLVADPPDLFDEDRGIYVYGSTPYETWYPYFDANFWEEWERDVHVEVFEPDGTRVVAQDAGIQIAGGYSRAFDQRNFELLARSGYSSETFDARLFPDEDIEAWHRLYLRNGGDWCSTQIVDASVQALLRDADGRRLGAFDAQAYRPVLVYLNGTFWGLYELKERLDEWYAADHHGEDPEDLDRVEVGWTHEANWDLVQGDWEAFDALESLATTQDLASSQAWADFEARVDVTNFAAQVVAENWISNSDWGTNNLRMWRPHDDDGRWRWMVYDFGHGWPSASSDYLSTARSTSTKGMRFREALANEAFRVAVVNTHAELLNTTMAGDAAAATVQRLADDVAPAMAMQRARWCGTGDTSAFYDAVAYAVQFARARARVMDDQIVAQLAPGGHATLSLTAEGSGTFRLSVVEVEAPFTGTFYVDTPVTVTAVPADGWVFDGWSDPDLGEDSTAILTMAGDVEVGARFVERE